jgi:hypothetical protein
MKNLFVLFFCLIAFEGTAQNPLALSETAEISLLTIAPGNELHSNFGHSALWIQDDENNINIVFNYGIFSFDTPGFYLKFVRGKLDYMLGAQRIDGFLYPYKAENRSVFNQKLNLTTKEKNAVYAYLVNNIQPENKYYKYDFFYDNCSTRIRDLLEEVLGDKLTWNREAAGYTFRNYLDIYLAEKPWQDFGIDLALGQPTDKLADKRNEMFLPDLLMYHFDEATVAGEKLVAEKKTIFQGALEKESSGFTILPKYITWLICILGVFFSIRHHKSDFNDRLFNRILFFVTGLLGCLIFFLWFLSDHIATANNWNIIWAFPLNVMMAFLLFKKPAKKWHTFYYAVFGVICFALLGFFYALPQQLHIAVFPIVLYFTFKSFNLMYRTKKMNV